MTQPTALPGTVTVPGGPAKKSLDGKTLGLLAGVVVAAIALTFFVILPLFKGSTPAPITGPTSVTQQQPGKPGAPGPAPSASSRPGDPDAPLPPITVVTHQLRNPGQP